MPTGRRDETNVSSSPDASNFPAPNDSVLRQKFADKGLNTNDLVTLVGIYFLSLIYPQKKN